MTDNKTDDLKKDTSGAAPKVAASPWDEPIDLPDKDESKVSTFGSLDPNLDEAAIKEDKPVPFNVPSDVEDEKIGEEIPASQFIKKEIKRTDKSEEPKILEKPEVKTSRDRDDQGKNVIEVPLPSAHSSKVDPGGKPVDEKIPPLGSSGAKVPAKEATKTSPVFDVKPPKAPIEDQGEVGKKKVEIVPDIADIKKKEKLGEVEFQSKEGKDLEKLKKSDDLDDTGKDTKKEAKKLGFFARLKERSAKKKIDKKEMALIDKVPEAKSETDAFKPATFADEMPKSTLSAETSVPATETPTPSSSYVVPRPPDIPAPAPKPIQPPPRSPKKPKLKLTWLKVSFGVAAVLSLMIFLTEAGIMSLGLEKIYGTFGLEGLWGGLPKNPESALAISMVQGKGELNFKSQGSITLTINKSINSPITSPLVVVPNLLISPKDENLGPHISTFLAQESDYYYYDYSDSTSSSSDDTSSTETSDETSSFDYTDTSQEDYPGYSGSTSTIKEVFADFEMVSSNVATRSDFSIQQITGSDQGLSIITNESDLYLLSYGGIKYDSKFANNKWLNYQINTLKSQNAFSDFYSLKFDQGFSITGKRITNEKIGGKRCYKYQIDNLEIGDSLKAIGISSSMVQKISGNVWIGVSDHLIHKANITLIPSISSSVSRIDVNFEIYDYGIENTVQIPALSDKIEVELSQPTVLDATQVSSDDQRKSDLAKIKEALEQYKANLGSYPKSSNFENINNQGSVLSKTLVSEYLDTIPEDSKLDQGFWYGYRSDGTSFTLSTRLEDTSDPQITKIGDIYLHYVYNDN